MRLSAAPYGAVSYQAERESRAFDRPNYRLIRRMWTVCNRAELPPVVSIWRIKPIWFKQPSLPFVASKPDWLFLRAVSTAVWWTATGVGSNVLEDLTKLYPEGVSYEHVKAWFEKRPQPYLVNKIVHECTPACLELRPLYVGFPTGLGRMCYIEPVTPEMKAACYATFTWLCSPIGREFTRRYTEASTRLYKLRGLAAKYNKRHDELRKSGQT